MVKFLENSRFNDLQDRITRFFYSDLMLAMFTLVTIWAWMAKIFILGFMFAIFYLIIALIFIDDASLLITPILMITFCISENEDLSKYIPYAAFLVPLVASIIFHIVVYRKKFKIGYMFIPQVLISIALLLGGVGRIDIKVYALTITYPLLLGLGILLLYAVFYIFTNFDTMKKIGVDPKIYFAKVFAYTGLIVAIQLFHVFLSEPDISVFQREKFMSLGWGIDNNGATYLLITAPLTMYLATKKECKYTAFFYVLAAAAQYLAIITSFSRGGILFAALTVFFVIGFTIKKTPHKKAVIIAVVGVFLGLLVIYLARMDTFNRILNTILRQGTGTSNRDKLYKEAIDCFRESPFIGMGMGYQSKHFTGFIIEFSWFHSTFFQIIGSMGIMGIFTFGIFYLVRYRIVFNHLRRSKFSLFCLLALIGFEGYSMIDTGTFVPLPFMLVVMFLTMLLEFMNRDMDTQMMKDFKATVNGQLVTVKINNKVYTERFPNK